MATMQPEARALPQGLDNAEFQDKVRALIDTNIAACRVSAGAEASNVRRVTVQVADRLRVTWKGRWTVFLYIATTEGGPPNGSQLVSFVDGTVLVTILANGAWIAQTDAEGKLTLDVDVSGAGSRFFYSLVLGKVTPAVEVAWT